MTLASPTSRVQYNGDDSTILFPVTFVFWNLDDPQATLADSDGVETTWVRGTHYTMSGGSGLSGTLTVITSPTDYTPATGETLTIVSDLANTQPSVFPLGGPFPTNVLEQQLDQIVRQVQQISEEIDRSIRLKVSSSESDVFIDDLLGNAAKFLRVNTAEDGIEHATVVPSGSIGVPVAVNEGGTAATTAAVALTNLAAAGTGISNTFTKNQVWNKGTDLTSASPLVLGSDGNFWDVTGVTGFSQITCTASTLFMLQFDGVLTMTDGANLDLGGVDITTAAGDRGLFFAIAANKALLITYFQEGGRMPGPDYTSAETSLDNDAQITFAHGLVTVPRKVEVVLRANTATAQGWADNEEMVFPNCWNGAVADDAVNVTADATNIYITAGANIQALDHTSFNDETITQTEYDWEVRAWK